MQIGVMVNGDSPEHLSSQLHAARNAGYTCVQITPAPTGDPGEVADALIAANLSLVAVGGYVNPLRDDLSPLQHAIQSAGHLDCPVVVTWSGTLAPDLFADDPENTSAAVFDQTVARFRPIAAWAEAAGVTVAIEPFHHHVARSPERLRDLIAAVDSPGLAAVMDPPNFLPASQVPHVNDLLPGMFATLRGQIALAHAKDLRLPEPGETSGVLGGVVLPGPGAGIMDYPQYLRLLQEEGIADVIVEHITPAEMAAAHDLVAASIAAPRN